MQSSQTPLFRQADKILSNEVKACFEVHVVTECTAASLTDDEGHGDDSRRTSDLLSADEGPDLEDDAFRQGIYLQCSCGLE